MKYSIIGKIDPLKSAPDNGVYLTSEEYINLFKSIFDAGSEACRSATNLQIGEIIDERIADDWDRLEKELMGFIPIYQGLIDNGKQIVCAFFERSRAEQYMRNTKDGIITEIWVQV